MGYLTLYIIIGLLFIRMIEGLGNWAQSEIKINNRERLVISVLWPIGFLIFSFTIIKEIINPSE